MNYASITNYDVNNGPGFRVSLWVQGCTIRCPGCHNEELWNFKNGKPFTDDTIKEIVEMVNKPEIDGLSILGGEPLDQDREGIEMLRKLCSEVKKLNKTIWLYTGYIVDSFGHDCLLSDCDVIVDGPYKAEQRDTSLAFRGSKNQRLIDAKASTSSYYDTHEIVEWNSKN